MLIYGIEIKYVTFGVKFAPVLFCMKQFHAVNSTLNWCLWGGMVPHKSWYEFVQIVSNLIPKNED